MIVPVVKTPAASPNQAPSEEDPNLVHLGCISLSLVYISISQLFLKLFRDSAQFNFNLLVLGRNQLCTHHLLHFFKDHTFFNVNQVRK